MWGERIKKAKEALILFIRSLPAGCKFSVISFGSNSSDLNVDSSYVIQYNESNAQSAINQIQHFDSDMDGTDIAEPLTRIITMDVPGLKKRVFCLTDGAVGNPNDVI